MNVAASLATLASFFYENIRYHILKCFYLPSSEPHISLTYLIILVMLKLRPASFLPVPYFNSSSTFLYVYHIFLSIFLLSSLLFSVYLNLQYFVEFATLRQIMRSRILYITQEDTKAILLESTKKGRDLPLRHSQQLPWYAGITQKRDDIFFLDICNSYLDVLKFRRKGTTSSS